MLRASVKLVQQFPRQVVLATEPARRRIQKLVERARPQTVKAALAKLDDRFSNTATATNRDAKLAEINYCYHDMPCGEPLLRTRDPRGKGDAIGRLVKMPILTNRPKLPTRDKGARPLVV